MKRYILSEIRNQAKPTLLETKVILGVLLIINRLSIYFSAISKMIAIIPSGKDDKLEVSPFYSFPGS